MQNNPTKHHWVPVCYIRCFRDPSTPLEEPLIWVFSKDKPLKKPHLSKPKSIFFENDLYTIELPDGEKCYDVEIAYAQEIDGKYPHLIKKIEAHEPLTDTDHQNFCLFVAAQMMRTPQVRDSIIAFMTEVASMEESIAAAHGKKSKMPEELKKNTKNSHTLNILELIPRITDVLYKMNVAFVCAPKAGKRFITSDNPVLMRNPDLQWQRFYGPGLMQERVEIYFPASPTSLAVFGWQNYRGYIHTNNKWVSETNRWIQAHATMWFAAPSKKRELYWFSRYPADLIFLLKILRFHIGILWHKLKKKYG